MNNTRRHAVIGSRLLKLSLLLACLAAPMASAQSATFPRQLGDGIVAFCEAQWSGREELETRLFTACVREQQQALDRLESVHRQFSRQSFYQQVALPFCRFEQGRDVAVNLVQVSFCLENELAGYREIQQLRSRYGSGRIDTLTSSALSRSGSWAAAASLIKRESGLKTIRRGESS